MSRLGRHVDEMKGHSDAFVNEAKEMMDLAVKSSVSLSTFEYIDADELKALQKIFPIMKHFEEYVSEYNLMLRALDERFDDLERKIDKINTKLEVMSRRDK